MFGLCIGSFLNVLVFRLPKNKSIFGRSFCHHCKKKLKWYELFPLFSFVFQKGKCRSCKKQISLQYPLIEAITGLLFVFVFHQSYFSNLLILFLQLFIMSCLLVIFLTDLKYMIVPNVVVYSGFVASFILQIANLKAGNLSNLFSPILSSIIAFLFFLFLVIITKGKGMGVGDVKVGAFLGMFFAWPDIAIVLFLSFLTGSIVGIFLIGLKKKNLKSEIPLASFLVLSSFAVFFLKEELIEWHSLICN